MNIRSLIVLAAMTCGLGLVACSSSGSSSAGGSSAGGSSASGGSGGSGGALGGTGDPCADDSECESGLCETAGQCS